MASTIVLDSFTPSITRVSNEVVKKDKNEIEKKKKKYPKYLYSAILVANLIAYTLGLSLTWSSPVISKLNGKVKTDDLPLGKLITKEEESWIGSLLTLGAACSPYIAGFLADRLGRKLSLIICGGILYLASFLILAFAKKVELFFVARLMGGFAMGSVLSLLPNYISEISPAYNRGALGSTINVFLTFGLFSSYVIGPFVSIKIFSVYCAIFPALFIILFAFYPETPYYLVQKGRYHDAELSLQKLRREQDVIAELESVKKTVEDRLVRKKNFFAAFKSRSLIKALSMSFGLVLFQQFSGINVVLFYTQTIFQATGSKISSTISSMIIGGAQLIPSAITYFVIDRAGRRMTLLFSALGMIVSETPLGIYFYLKENHYDVSSIYWLPILSLVVFIFTYRIGFGPLPWTVMAELFPPDVKSTASALTTSFCYVLGFFITRYFQRLAEVIGMSGGFWIFAGFCFLAAFFSYFYLPETKKKSFQEINAILYGNKISK